jgi:endonuclease/exonuclease/phosphatase family metal-dependent hydrolase
VKVISWNLLRLTGAAVEDVADLIERERPDLMLMQEATQGVHNLPALAGGSFQGELLPGRIYGLAAWSPKPLQPGRFLPLPVSQMPGRLPLRLAQILEVDGVTFANVHLSHGQILNRRQLAHIARALEGPAAVIGDFNAVGPVMLSSFRDIGPRQPTHVLRNVPSFRLDRCLVRGLRCTQARVLGRGRSDHHPIILELHPAQESERAHRRGLGFVRRRRIRAEPRAGGGLAA